MAAQDHTIISRADAKSQGLAFYFTGKRCKHGKLFLRKTCTGQCQCKDCQQSASESRKKWYAKNSDRHKAMRDDWYSKNKEKKLLDNAQWERGMQLSNPEYFRAKQSKSNKYDEMTDHTEFHRSFIDRRIAHSKT